MDNSKLVLDPSQPLPDSKRWEGFIKNMVYSKLQKIFDLSPENPRC
jgi:hypothetical protein